MGACLRRSPHGERGLKSDSKNKNDTAKGRSPHGERGLKYFDGSTTTLREGRSPHGERGLKFHFSDPRCYLDTSLPTRGAWIEILTVKSTFRLLIVAPHTGSVD